MLDRCVTTNNEYDLNKPMVWVNFNYEFLDDICVESSEESLIEWRPKVSAKDHPLALMVSLLNTLILQLHSGVCNYGLYMCIVDDQPEILSAKFHLV